MISRTDSIGDVVLTLPMAGLLKQNYPECRVIFLGRSYTKDVVSVCRFVDDFINYDDVEKMPWYAAVKYLRSTRAKVFIHVFPRMHIAWLAFSAMIKHRAGTRSRWYHIPFCNHLADLHRKNSDLHESQLNLKLMAFMNINTRLSTDEISSLTGMSNLSALPAHIAGMIDPSRINVILHPKSKGSAAEWGIENFSQLIGLLTSDRYKVFISGTAQDGVAMQDLLLRHRDVVNLCGLLSLREFIAFITKADVLVAASTGPLHIAASVGIRAVGLYSARRPIFPRRWSPLGAKAHALVSDEKCTGCAKGEACDCIRRILPSRVKEFIDL